MSNSHLLTSHFAAQPSVRPYSSYVDSRGKASPLGLRISYINGIFNMPQTCGRTAQVVSQLHAGVKVAYVYHASRGLAPDIRAATSHMLGLASSEGEASALLLSRVWQELYNQLLRETDHPHIVHYAHSYGAWLSYQAALKVPEVNHCLDLRLFGSPCIVPHERFKSVRHIATPGDPITWLAYLSIYRRLSAPHVIEAEVAMQGEAIGWRQKHHLLGPAYGPVIAKMGRDFELEIKRAQALKLLSGERIKTGT